MAWYLPILTHEEFYLMLDLKVFRILQRAVLHFIAIHVQPARRFLSYELQGL